MDDVRPCSNKGYFSATMLYVKLISENMQAHLLTVQSYHAVILCMTYIVHTDNIITEWLLMQSYSRCSETS